MEKSKLKNKMYIVFVLRENFMYICMCICTHSPTHRHTHRRFLTGSTPVNSDLSLEGQDLGRLLNFLYYISLFYIVSHCNNEALLCNLKTIDSPQKKQNLRKNLNIISSNKMLLKFIKTI